MNGPDDLTLAHALRTYCRLDAATVDHDRGCVCVTCTGRRQWANESVRRAKAADVDLMEVAQVAGKDLPAMKPVSVDRAALAPYLTEVDMLTQTLLDLAERAALANEALDADRVLALTSRLRADCRLLARQLWPEQR